MRPVGSLNLTLYLKILKIMHGLAGQVHSFLQHPPPNWYRVALNVVLVSTV